MKTIKKFDIFENENIHNELEEENDENCGPNAWEQEENEDDENCGPNAWEQEENEEESKRLKRIKEHQEQKNYMFFGNLKTIKRLVDEMLEMDEAKVDAILSDGHNWALDHMATSKDDIEEVFNFLAGHESHDQSDQIEPMSNQDHVKGGIQSFNDFKK
jgi:hypothetical protein